MRINLVIANGLRIAREDLDAARLLLPSNNRNTAYHCEQAAEKIIKAILTSEGIHAGREHDLAQLVGLLPEENPFKPRLREVEHLSDFATAYRYVTTPAGRIKPGPSVEELGRIVARVEEILRGVAERFGVEFAEKDTPARRPGPIR